MADREKRTARFELRLTEAEAERIRDRAEASGLSAAAFIRRAALTGGEPAPIADARELRPLYAELLGSWGMLPVTRQARGQQRDATLHPSPDDLIRQARADVMADERTQPQQRRGFGRAR